MTNNLKPASCYFAALVELHKQDMSWNTHTAHPFLLPKFSYEICFLNAHIITTNTHVCQRERQLTPTLLFFYQTSAATVFYCFHRCCEWLFQRYYQNPHHHVYLFSVVVGVGGEQTCPCESATAELILTSNTHGNMQEVRLCTVATAMEHKNPMTCLITWWISHRLSDWSPTQHPRGRWRLGWIQVLNIDAAAGRRDIYVASVVCQTLFVSIWGGSEIARLRKEDFHVIWHHHLAIQDKK